MHSTEDTGVPCIRSRYRYFPMTAFLAEPLEIDSDGTGILLQPVVASDIASRQNQNELKQDREIKNDSP